MKFEDLPVTFDALCLLKKPRRIENNRDYMNVLKISNVMAGHESDFTKDQEDFFDLLCLLIEYYEEHDKH